jgi:hypothetical protein
MMIKKIEAKKLPPSVPLTRLAAISATTSPISETGRTCRLDSTMLASKIGMLRKYTVVALGCTISTLTRIRQGIKVTIYAAGRTIPCLASIAHTQQIRALKSDAAFVNENPLDKSEFAERISASRVSATETITTRNPWRRKSSSVVLGVSAC